MLICHQNEEQSHRKYNLMQPFIFEIFLHFGKIYILDRYNLDTKTVCVCVILERSPVQQ